MNKCMTVLAIAVLALALTSTVAFADPNDNAAAKVFLNIDPNIAISGPASVNAGTLQTGPKSVEITFRVDANTEAVKLSALVTDLWKGDDPTGTAVSPIPVDQEAGVEMDPTNANPINGSDSVAQYTGTGSYSASEGVFPGRTTEQITFESSQNGHFSQNVVVTPQWVNIDNEKPQGQYSGYVVLFAGVVV